jgi:hypothetical protein
MADDELIGRKVDVFWPEEEAWFGGTVVEKGKKPTADTEDGELGVGWKVEYDDGDEGWVANLRGNHLVRFIGALTTVGGARVVSPLGSPVGAASGLGAEDADDLEGAPKSTFASETFSSALPDYTNVESENVRQAFMPMNFHTLSKLPTRIRPDAVLRSKQVTLKKNLSAVNRPAPEHKSLSRHGLFHSFEYIPSKFTRQDDIARQERLRAETKMHSISSAPFLYASTARPMKYEDAFDDKDLKFPYMGDPYEGARDQQNRIRWISESKTLHGPFLPTGKATALSSTPTRSLLPDMVRQIHATLRQDWPTCNFSVMVNEEDSIIMRFEGSTVDSLKALLGYMNTMMRDHSQALPGSRWYNRYNLRRVVEDWARQDDEGYIFFTVRPPWVKISKLNTFLTLRPESRVVTPLGTPGKPQQQATALALPQQPTMRAGY